MHMCVCLYTGTYMSPYLTASLYLSFSLRLFIWHLPGLSSGLHTQLCDSILCLMSSSFTYKASGHLVSLKAPWLVLSLIINMLDMYHFSPCTEGTELFLPHFYPVLSCAQCFPTGYQLECFGEPWPVFMCQFCPMKPFHVWDCPRRSLSEVVLLATRQCPVKTLYW